jgi:hypothetical protein
MDIRVDSKELQLRRKMVENIATRVFRKKKERPVVPTNLMELKVRGNFEGAPISMCFCSASRSRIRLYF